jgi:hypothetical protein
MVAWRKPILDIIFVLMNTPILHESSECMLVRSSHCAFLFGAAGVNALVQAGDLVHVFYSFVVVHKSFCCCLLYYSGGLSWFQKFSFFFGKRLQNHCCELRLKLDLIA